MKRLAIIVAAVFAATSLAATAPAGAADSASYPGSIKTYCSFYTPPSPHIGRMIVTKAHPYAAGNVEPLGIVTISMDGKVLYRYESTGFRTLAPRYASPTRTHTYHLLFVPYAAAYKACAATRYLYVR